MLQHEISKELLASFAEDLKKRFPYSTEQNRNLIKRGLLLYRQGSVYNVSYDEQFIQGKVQDVVPVTVSINVNKPDEGSCSCPADDFCRHQMALFFYVYASVSRVGSLLDEWKTAIEEPVSKVLQQSFVKAKDLQNPYEDMSLTSWYAFFSREYDQFIEQSNDQDRYLISLIYQRLFQSFNVKSPKQSELKKLFTIHAGIFCIDKIQELVSTLQLKQYQFDSYVTPFVHNLIDQVVDDIFYLKQVSLPFSYDSLLEESMDKIRTILLRDSWFQFERVSVYRGLWSSIFFQKKWIEKERTRLLENQEAIGHTIALAHLSFLLKHDEEAIQYVNSLEPPYLVYSFWWINVLSNAKDWKRAKVWIEYSAGNIQHYLSSMDSYQGRRHLTRVFLRDIYEYCHNHDQHLYFQVMKNLLPFSYVEFNTYLLESKDYRTWADLQMALGYDISECERQTIKDIEEHDRGALLPLYHEAVLKALDQKNRASYKQAVKYLRKLRTIYRRLNQLEKWDIYIDTLATTYKRLRAFQEELTKAKLISD